MRAKVRSFCEQNGDRGQNISGAEPQNGLEAAAGVGDGEEEEYIFHDCSDEYASKGGARLVGAK
jgi:hypothetical protein